MQHETHIYSDAVPQAPSLHGLYIEVDHDAAAAVVAEAMLVHFLAHQVEFHGVVAALDELDIFTARVDEDVTRLSADGTVALVDLVLWERRGQGDVEDNGAAMAGATIGARRFCFFGHSCDGSRFLLKTGARQSDKYTSYFYLWIREPHTLSKPSFLSAKSDQVPFRLQPSQVVRGIGPGL